MRYERVKPLRREHVEHVMSHLWERGRLELHGLGVSPADAVEMCMAWAPKGPTCAVLHDGVPVCVFGANLDDGDRFSWFQATEDFPDHVLEISRAIRGVTKAIDDPLYIYSQCLHHRTERWFRTLGFRPDDWFGRTEKGAALRRFVRG